MDEFPEGFEPEVPCPLCEGFHPLRAELDIDGSEVYWYVFCPLSPLAIGVYDDE